MKIKLVEAEAARKIVSVLDKEEETFDGLYCLPENLFGEWYDINGMETGVYTIPARANRNWYIPPFFVEEVAP